MEMLGGQDDVHPALRLVSTSPLKDSRVATTSSGKQKIDRRVKIA